MVIDSIRYCALAVLLAALIGCQPAVPTADVPVNAASATSSLKIPAEDEIQRQVDDALNFTFTRRLDTKVNAAWQIMHGCIPYKQEFLIRHDGKDVRAIEFLFGGGTVEGWEFEPGVVLDPTTGRRGLRAIPRPGSNRGQGHEDQWLGYLSGCNMPLETTITVGDVTYTLADWLAEIEHDVPRNVQQEYSWTLMALATYRDYDYHWTAGDGNTWDLPKLIEIELDYDVNDSPCGGSHRMVGLVMALNKCKTQGGKIEGIWQRLDDRVKELVARAKEYQNPDGSLSSEFFVRPSKSADIAKAIGAAGHVLEFVLVASDDEEIKEEWITRAVLAQCKMFRATKKVDLECGGLYHSASALRIYRERMFGPLSFAAE